MKALLLSTMLVVGGVSTAHAQDTSSESYNPFAVVSAGFATAEVVTAAGNQVAKIINPEHSAIGNFDVDQQLFANDIYVKRGLISVNTVGTYDINAGSLTARQVANMENVNVIDGVLYVNGVKLVGSTYGRVFIKQVARLRNVTIDQGSFIGNQVVGR